MDENRLTAKLTQSEDPWVERKESFDEREVRKTLVAFANSLPQGSEPAVLFLGASNKGRHPGLLDADGTQKQVRAQAVQNSYPSIDVTMKVFIVKVGDATKEILAVIVPPSENKPHFAGVAFVREGSESIRASEAVFKELVASQNDIVRKLQKYQGRKVMLTIMSHPNRLRIEYVGVLIRIDAHTIEINTEDGIAFPFPTNSVEMLYQLQDLPHIKATIGWTEAEMDQRMIEKWALAHPEADGIPSGWNGVHNGSALRAPASDGTHDQAGSRDEPNACQTCALVYSEALDDAVKSLTV